MYFSGCTFFYTFALQAIYRLCRILYRAKVRLHSIHLYTILSVGLWILTSCELLPSLLINDIKYIPNDYHCQFAPTDMRGSFTIYSVGFLLPFIVTICCYMWTMYNIRQQTIVLVTINQQTSMRRDIIVLKRLMIFLTIVTIVAAPHILLPIVYIIIESLPEWIISVEWLITTLALLAVAIISLFTAPHLKKLWTGSQAIHPNGTVTMIALQR